MKLKVDFVSLEDDDKDLILSFVIPDEETGVKSLILLRTLFYEELLPEEERGVKVSLEGDTYDEEDFNMLIGIEMSGEEVNIKSTYREYKLDVSNIEQPEIQSIIKLLRKQNHDNRFNIQIA